MRSSSARVNRRSRTKCDMSASAEPENILSTSRVKALLPAVSRATSA